MDRIDWYILNTLSDDFESMTQIYPLEEASDVAREEIIDRIERMFKHCLIQLPEKVEFNKEKILGESEEFFNTTFWFGLTDKGAEEWERNAKEYGGFEIDWSAFWSTHFDYENEKGFIVAVNKEISLKQLKKVTEVEIDFNTLRITEVPEFQATYYKKIKGGIKIEFEFKQMRSN
jgi:DNA-binding Lrp family transcriptional regulator